MLDTDEAMVVYGSFGGDESVLYNLDLGDWHDHERFARELQRVITATGQVLLVESVPTCGHCRGRHGGNRIRFDYLDAGDEVHPYGRDRVRSLIHAGRVRCSPSR